jgi:hypothetical protein
MGIGYRSSTWELVTAFAVARSERACSSGMITKSHEHHARANNLSARVSTESNSPPQHRRCSITMKGRDDAALACACLDSGVTDVPNPRSRSWYHSNTSTYHRRPTKHNSPTASNIGCELRARPLGLTINLIKKKENCKMASSGADPWDAKRN